MRKWLYHKSAEPTIFKGEEAIQKAIEDGWETRPIDITKKQDIQAEVVKKPKAKKEKPEVIEDKQKTLIDE